MHIDTTNTLKDFLHKLDPNMDLSAIPDNTTLEKIRHKIYLDKTLISTVDSSGLLLLNTPIKEGILSIHTKATIPNLVIMDGIEQTIYAIIGYCNFLFEEKELEKLNPPTPIQDTYSIILEQALILLEHNVTMEIIIHIYQVDEYRYTYAISLDKPI